MPSWFGSAVFDAEARCRFVRVLEETFPRAVPENVFVGQATHTLVFGPPAFEPGSWQISDSPLCAHQDRARHKCLESTRIYPRDIHQSSIHMPRRIVQVDSRSHHFNYLQTWLSPVSRFMSCTLDCAYCCLLAWFHTSCVALSETGSCQQS